MTYDEADRIYRDVTPTTHINLKNYIDCSDEFGLRNPKFGTDKIYKRMDKDYYICQQDIYFYYIGGIHKAKKYVEACNLITEMCEG